MKQIGDDDCRIIEIPFPFGTVVFHAIRTERIPGMVTAYNVRNDRLTIGVTWGDSISEAYHHPYELTTEYEPLFPGS